MKLFVQRTISGLFGGLLSGIIAGLLEAVMIIQFNQATLVLEILPFAVAMYGLVGLVAGLAMGFGLGILALLHKRISPSGHIQAFIGGAFLAANVLAVGRYRVFRDVMKEHPIPTLGQLALLAAAAVAFLLFWRVGRLILRRRPAFIAINAGAVVLLIVSALTFPLLKHDTVDKLPGRPTDPFAGRPGVILLMIDTLRWDYISSYGQRTATTPAMDALAADGVRFHNMFANSTWTRPSVATILTGLYPSSHQAAKKSDIMPDAVNTLAEQLSAGGVYTAGYANNINVAHTFNFQQGFNEYYYLGPDYFFGATSSSSQLAYYSILRKVRETVIKSKRVSHYYQDAVAVNDHGQRWLMANGQPGNFFLFLHYMDPHDPYFIHPYNGVGYARVAMPNPPPEMAETLEQAYRGEVEFLDQKLGEFFGWLKAQGLYDSSMIILTGDHGEEFFEHNGWWHGDTLYDEQMRVPLIIKYPGNAFSGTVASAMVSSIDIAPTVLDLFQLPVPDGLPGRSLLQPDAAGQGQQSVFAEENFEGNLLFAARTPTWKLVRANPDNHRKLPATELLDLQSDPGERNNVAQDSEARVKALDRVIEQTMKDSLAQAVSGQETSLDEAVRAQMRALGYIQ